MTTERSKAVMDDTMDKLYVTYLWRFLRLRTIAFFPLTIGVQSMERIHPAYISPPILPNSQ